MSLRALAVSGLAAAGLLLTVPAAQAAAPVQLTGTQLASRLLPPSSFPSGYKIVKSGTYSSGRHLEDGPVKHHLASFSCKTYIVNGLPRTGFGETATAGSIVNKPRVGAYQQGVFPSNFDVPLLITNYWKGEEGRKALIAGKARFTDPQFVDVWQTMARYPAYMAKGFQAQKYGDTQTLFATGFPATINDTLYTVSGRNVYFIDAAGNKHAPSKPGLSTAVQHLVARVVHLGPRVPA